MNEPSDTPDIDSICEEFEAAWKIHKRPQIESCLESVSAEKQAELLCELLQIELWWRRGESPLPSIEEYQARFRDYGDAVAVGFKAFEMRTLVQGKGPFKNANDEQATLPASTDKLDGVEDRTLAPDQRQDQPNETPTGDRVRYFGEYELLDEIARGGMGVVYKARQVKLNRIVALKMILSGELAGDEEIQRFKTEAEAAANLDHTGIVPIYEIGEHGGQHYFSMGFIEGQSLQERIRNGPLEPREAVHLCVKISEAIAYAHDKGVIHRDLKPANILLDRDGTAKVTDFGLAKQVESDSDLTRTGAVMGTPSYMPPEQAAGRTDEIGPLADVYSLGAVLYAMLTGRPPFQSSNSLGVILQVLEKEPVPPGDLNPQIESDIETITLKCLEKNRHSRYRSANELLADLRRFLADEPILARPPTFGYRFRKAFKKHQAAFLTAASVAALLIVGLTVTLVMWRRATQAEQNAILSESDARKSELVARKAESNAKLQLSRSNFFLANSRFREGRLLDAHRFLDNIPSEHRDIEWFLAREQMKGGDLTYFEHQEAIRAVAYSPDGKYVASGGTSVHLWDPVTGKKLATLNTDAGEIYDLALSPDGKQLAVAHERYIGLWDLETKKISRKLVGHSKAISSVDFSDDGKFLVSGSVDTLVVVWNVENGSAKILRGHGNGSSLGSVNFVHFLSNGNVLSSSFDGTIRQWTPDTESQFSTEQFGKLNCLADVGPAESKLVANVAGRLTLLQVDGTRLWEVPSQYNGHPVFSPDGSLIAVRPPDNSLAILDASTGLELQRLRGHWNRISSISFSPDARRIATASWDGTIKIWSLDAPVGRKLELGGPVRFGNGNELVSWWKIENSYSGETIFETDEKGYNVSELATSRDTQFMVSSGGFKDNQLRVLSRPEGIVKTLAVHSNVPLTRVVWPGATAGNSKDQVTHKVPTFTLSPNGQFLVAGDPDDPGDNNPQLKLWRIDGAEPTLEWSTSANEPVRKARFNPDGNSIATSSVDGPVRIWRTSDGKQIGELSGARGVSKILFSLDGKCLICRAAGFVGIWKTSNLQLAKKIQGVGTQDFAISASGRRLLTIDGSRKVKTLRLWDVASGEELSSYTTSQGKIQLHPNGELILLGQEALWTAPRKTEFTVLSGHRDPVGRAAFSQDGKRIYSESVDQRLVWDTKTGNVIEDVAWEDPKAFSSRSSDGTKLVHAIDSAILLVDLTYGESQNVASLRKAKAKTKGWWHTQKAQHAIKKNDYFSCEFHASRALVTEQDSEKLYEVLAQSTLKVTEEKIARLRIENKAKSTPIDKLEKSTAAKINEAIWEKVVPSQAQPTTQEIESMIAVARDFPSDFSLRTLGVAEYRSGNYLAALHACLKSFLLGTKERETNQPATGETQDKKLPPKVDALFEHPTPPSAVDVAIISMCSLRLGNKAVAEAYRSQLNEIMELEPFKDDKQCLQFLAEVNQLFDDSQ